MTDKITPKKAREVLKKSASNPIRHHRVGGKKTEVATEMVLNAAGKSRSVYSSGVVDLSMTGERLRDTFISEGVFPSTTVADLFRLGTGCYWSKVDDHIKYARGAFGDVSPFDVEFQPLETESSEMTKTTMDEIGVTPSSSVSPLYEEIIRILPKSESPAYSGVNDPIAIFFTLLNGGSVDGVEIPTAL